MEAEQWWKMGKLWKRSTHEWSWWCEVAWGHSWFSRSWISSPSVWLGSHTPSRSPHSKHLKQLHSASVYMYIYLWSGHTIPCPPAVTHIMNGFIRYIQKVWSPGHTRHHMYHHNYMLSWWLLGVRVCAYCVQKHFCDVNHCIVLSTVGRTRLS